MGRQFAGASSAAKIQTPATRQASPSIDNADVSSSEPGAPNIAGTSTAAGKKRSDAFSGDWSDWCAAKSHSPKSVMHEASVSHNSGPAEPREIATNGTRDADAWSATTGMRMIVTRSVICQ
jgi:hypothetical protein